MISRPLTEKAVKQLIFFNLFVSILLFGCMYYYAFLLKRTMEWNRDLDNRQYRLEMELGKIKSHVDGNKVR